MRMIVWIVVLLAVVTSAAGLILHSMQAAPYDYKTAHVRKGDIVASITANGTLEPIEIVDVGAQVEGQIASFGKDSNGKSIDNNSPVEPRMVLAKIDDTVYKADVDVAQAQLEQAKTAILKAKADLGQANSKLTQADHNWTRARTLGPSDALSQNDYDMYQADYATAQANVAIAQSEIAQAENGVPLAQAQLDKAKRNLEFCTIYSPVQGMLLDRRVNIGQTVVSSLNTPSLFLIARDLTRMQIWVSVNEADVGRVVPGTPVTFTCEAFPDQVFDGKVGKIRWNAAMNQNVVLYTVEVEVDNAKMILHPFMTAKVQFEVAKDSNAMIVPNLALRWVPASTNQIAPDARSAMKTTDDATAGNAPHKEHHGTVWVKDGQYVRPVEVKLGVTDRTDTSVSSESLKDGDEVITGDNAPVGDASVKNPFLPPAQPRRH